jgi:transcriptional regulator with XRE-family HTH domain
MTPEQSRAGRAWLDWSQQELAAKASVSLSTVRDYEKGRRVPIANNLTAMRTALEAAGIAFVETTGISFAKRPKRR